MPASSSLLPRLVLLLAGVCGWLACLLAVLQISQLDLGLGHSMCGSWGCGPPLEALIACHGFWLVLLTPPATLAARRSSLGTLSLVSATAVGTGLAGVIGVVLWQAGTYPQQFVPGETSFFLRRCLLVIATTIEFPMLQLLLLGVGGWLYAGRRRRLFLRAQRQTAPTEIEAR